MLSVIVPGTWMEEAFAISLESEKKTTFCWVREHILNPGFEFLYPNPTKYVSWAQPDTNNAKFHGSPIRLNLKLALPRFGQGTGDRERLPPQVRVKDNWLIRIINYYTQFIGIN